MATFPATFQGLLDAVGELRGNINAALLRRDTAISDVQVLAQQAKDGLAVKANAATVAAKLDKPTGSGQLVYNATTGAWEAAPTGGSATPATVTYANGAWPARPTVAGSVSWIDPTGSAPVPTGFQTGDLLLDYDAAAVAATLIPENQASMTEWWYVYGGSASVDGAAGTVQVTKAADKVGASIDVTGAHHLRVTIYPASGSTGTYAVQLVSHATSGNVYTWAGDSAQGNQGKANSAGAQFLDITTPADATSLEVVLTGDDANTQPAILDRCSVVEI